MLPSPAAIINPTSLGGGQYTFDLFFSVGTQARYLRVGDYVESGANGDQYEVLSWSTQPGDFSSGTQVTVQFVDNDTTPTTDSGFNSSVFTLGQQDVRPAVRTSGSIGAISLFSGQNFEYTVSAGWNDLTEANQAVVGDSIVDSNGKEFEISFLSASRFNAPFRVIEVAKEGVAPVSGSSSLYRATTELGLFQGTPITDPARTVVRNRDGFTLDQKITVLESQLGTGGSSLELSVANGTGSDFSALTALSVNSSGEVVVCDVTSEASARAFLGINKSLLADGVSGDVVLSGRLESITTSFDFQDPVYVARDGSLTNVAPEIGVDGFIAGDFVVFVGVIKRNEDTPANKDLILRPTLIGQL